MVVLLILKATGKYSCLRHNTKLLTTRNFPKETYYWKPCVNFSDNKTLSGHLIPTGIY
jgi:hypothetical protein